MVPASASAHILDRQGPITVLLHTDPNDQPQAHAKSQFLFIVANDNRVFSFDDYDTQVVVETNGKTLFDKKVFAPPKSFNSMIVDYTFPSIGVFDVTIKGTPKNGTKAEPFTADFTLRVDQIATASSQSHIWIILFAGAGGVVLILLFLRYVIGIKLKKPTIKKNPASPD